MFFFLGGEGGGAGGSAMGYRTAPSLSSFQRFYFLPPGEEGTRPMAKASL